MRLSLSTIVRVAAALGGLALTPTVTSAQSTLRGFVRDSGGAPMAGVDVQVLALNQLTRTDDKGRFTLPQLPMGEIEVTVRRLGYVPQEIPMVITATAADSMVVVLFVQPAMLATMTVRGAERRRQGVDEFYKRRTRNVGTFFSRADILEQRASVPSDVLRSTPGVQVVRSRTGRPGVRFMSASIVRRECMPMIWIDGQRAPGMELDDVPLNDIEGMELYHGPSTTPMQFSQASDITTCGTIVIWSRVPGK